MKVNKDLRIAWLLPVTWFYWQPMLSEFSRIYPSTIVFTGLFSGFAKGLDKAFKVEVVGKFRVVEINRDEQGYGDNFTYLSFGIIGHLLRLRPQVIFSSSFGIWTILAILLKPILWSKVVIAYEGSSPGVDYRNSFLRLFIRRLMVLSSDAYITNSHAGKEYLIKVLKARQDKVFVQPYEIPDERTLPGVSEVKGSLSSLLHPIFLFVGHVIPRKGLPLLLEACASLQMRGHTDYTLLVVGDGSQTSELQAFCQKSGLIDRIIWVGRVSYDQIGGYFEAADVFVFPTLEDTWGVVTLEAMLLGKPILCSKGAGTSELIVHGENGYVFSPDDSDGLANLMETFLNYPDKIQKMGDKSREIMARYTPQAAVECLAEVTELVLNGRNTSTVPDRFAP
ncbi:glycosyltransferase family 4 protein [Nodosilinea sp. LEGE 07088]|uniref:glycosyltransferase family 4 protein n=1 Tax=Nodosilinea sp. LEGE 07088 TaxID=2777968 RepID=UPI00187E3C26|nr:glycosyltransferase family 4 protein [Nodosilinea sp. LEGE 07088]MBE9141492.1 glycosyltransferase family 4 protein [Nodosilinea sp. LEGE 07088]